MILQISQNNLKCMHKMFNKKITSILFALASTTFVASAQIPKDMQRPANYESTALTLLKKGKHEEALKVLQNGVKNYPESTLLNYLLGKCYYDVKNYNKARYYLYRAVRYTPDDTQAKLVLVKVETETGNYSTAISYINDILKVSPYDKVLWLKKIDLYNRQGNFQMADRLLRRIAQVYPNDIDLQRRLYGRTEENIKKLRLHGNTTAAAENVRSLIKANPKQSSLYLQLANLLLQSGRSEEALAATIEGMERNPGNVALAEKRASILAVLHRYNEADTFLASFLKRHSSSKLAAMRKNMRKDAAEDALRNDAYTMYGKVYEESKSKEALDYLLNTSVSHGYTDDALYYLKEARKHQGNTPKLLFMEYQVYKRAGDKRHAILALEKLYKVQPSNREAVIELSAYRLEQAQDLMVTNDYTEAIPLLDFVIDHSSDKEQVLGAMNKKYTCLTETKQYGRASKLLDLMSKKFPNQKNYYIRKAYLLDSEGKTNESLDVLFDALEGAKDAKNIELYRSAYEELAVPYVKKLIEMGAIRRAKNTACNLLEVNPKSHDGLLFAINTSDMLKQYIDFDTYVERATELYPEDVLFQEKLATSYKRQKDYHKALDILRPLLSTYSYDSTLVGAYSENSNLLALELVKKHKGREAIAVVDTALVYDDKNKELLYTKGLAYESVHEYDSAYVYQRYYQPSAAEYSDFMIHLDMLRRKERKNILDFEYRQSRYGDVDVINSVASIAYTHKAKDNVYVGRINYAGRDGNDVGDQEDSYVPGGTGLQGQVEWQHRFDNRWSGMINAAVATKYFPKLAANIRLDYDFKNNWSANLYAGYRQLDNYYRTFTYVIEESEGAWANGPWAKKTNNMVNAGLGVRKTWDQFDIEGKAGLVFYASNLCYTSAVQGHYYPLDSKWLCFTAGASVGTAPETEIIDRAQPGSFDKINTMVNFGFQYQLSRMVTFNLVGIWNTFSNVLSRRSGDELNPIDYTETKYKNLFSIDGTLSIYF